MAAQGLQCPQASAGVDSISIAPERVSLWYRAQGTGHRAQGAGRRRTARRAKGATCPRTKGGQHRQHRAPHMRSHKGRVAQSTHVRALALTPSRHSRSCPCSSPHNAASIAHTPTPANRAHGAHRRPPAAQTRAPKPRRTLARCILLGLRCVTVGEFRVEVTAQRNPGTKEYHNSDQGLYLYLRLPRQTSVPLHAPNTSVGKVGKGWVRCSRGVPQKGWVRCKGVRTRRLGGACVAGSSSPAAHSGRTGLRGVGSA